MLLARLHPSLFNSIPDPLVKRYGSGSGSFHHRAKTVRKTFYYFWWLLYDFSLKNDVVVSSKSNKQKTIKKLIFVGVLKVTDEKSRIRIRIRIH